MKYDRDYFIKKFEAIPDIEIGSGSLKNHCSLWHCGVRKLTDSGMTPEAIALGNLIDDNKSPLWAVSDWNDGWSTREGATPKERIINKLKSI